MSESCVVTPGQRDPPPPSHRPGLVKDKQTKIHGWNVGEEEFPEVGTTMVGLMGRTNDTVVDRF